MTPCSNIPRSSRCKQLGRRSRKDLDRRQARPGTVVTTGSEDTENVGARRLTDSANRRNVIVHFTAKPQGGGALASNPSTSPTLYYDQREFLVHNLAAQHRTGPTEPGMGPQTGVEHQLGIICSTGLAGRGAASKYHGLTKLAPPMCRKNRQMIIRNARCEKGTGPGNDVQDAKVQCSWPGMNVKCGVERE